MLAPEALTKFAVPLAKACVSDSACGNRYRTVCRPTYRIPATRLAFHCWLTLAQKRFRPAHLAPGGSSGDGHAASSCVARRENVGVPFIGQLRVSRVTANGAG